MRAISIAVVMAMAFVTNANAELYKVCIRWETWSYVDYGLIHPKRVKRQVCRQWKYYR